MGDADQISERLTKRIIAIADPQVRVRYLRHQLSQMRPGPIADLITVALHRTEARDGDAGALLLALCLALAHERSHGIRDAVVHSALDQGQLETAAFLQPRPPDRLADGPTTIPDFGKGRQVSLGERKSLARTHDRDLLARVIRDPHPDVIRILMGNPILTEKDVVRLCAQRPVTPEVLREVFSSARWIVRYGVRKAIVKNPFTPVDIALQLSAHLTEPDARAVVDSPELSVLVRDACRRVAGMQTLH